MKNLMIQLNFLFLVLCFTACGQMTKPEEKRNRTETDTSITKQNSISDLFLDNLSIEEFILSHQLTKERSRQLREFYMARNYQFAWFDNGELAQQTHSFWNLHKRFLNYSGDSSIYNKRLHEQMKALSDEEEAYELNASAITILELELTDHFFDYARYAYTGRINPEEIKWHIPRKRVNAIRLLDSLIQKNGNGLDQWEPLNNQYKLVRQKLIYLYEIQKQGGWPKLAGGVYRKSDSAEAIKALKLRLHLSGDFPIPDSSTLFTSDFEEAVKKAQKRFGLTQDGVVGPATISRLNIPVEERIKQLLVNMERMRWMPVQREGTVLAVNIPEFRLHVYENEKEAFQMKIVVGKAANRTVVFSDQLQYIVFSPYWNVPKSIVRNEILPAMKNNPSYLAQNNMEQTGTSGGLPVIRQKPGAGNALGRVKFLFPNSYSIYFHDTPAKSLFDRQTRAFSHGCIRLEQPKRLAEYLLRNNEKWNEDRITTAMYSGKEQWVKLDTEVDVLITYFTAWVDGEGLLHLRDDIYGRDKELEERLFE